MKYPLLVFLIFFCLPGFSQSDDKGPAQPRDTSKNNLKNIKLKEVIIKAKQPLMEMGIDKTTVNVSAMISSAGSNTLEVLEKTPGIVVDAQGNISLNGRSGVMVLIDGRQTYMSGLDLASYLKSLPGANLDKIELMDNPPARYDAAGNGVINIRLKKNRTAGFTGLVSSGYTKGRLPKSNQSLNLNYNYKKVNVFTNLSYSDDQNYTEDYYNRSYYNSMAELSSTVLLNTAEESRSGAINVNLGMDYTISEQTSLSMQVGTTGTNRAGILGSNSKNYGIDGLDSIGNGHIDFGNDKRNLTANLSMVRKFVKSKSELSAEAGYLRYVNDGDASLQNNVLRPDELLLRTDQIAYEMPNTMSIYTLRSDYIHPLKKNGNLEAGLKWSRAENDNQYDSYQLINQGWIIDNSRSNHFVYSEDNLAAYMSGQRNWKRWGLKMGLRAEYTGARGVQLGNAEVSSSSFDKNYIKLFPSLFINYKLDTTATHSFSFSLTRRINRPNYYQLNPFVYYVDQYSYNSGNPALNPQYQYRYELKYQYKQLLRVGLSYNHFTNGIFNTTNVVDGIYFNKPGNISEGYMLLLNTGVSFDPIKWWNLSSDILLSRIGLKGEAYGKQLNPETYVARLNLMNRLDFGKGWNAEFGGYYASRDLNGQAFTAGMIRANAGIQKKLFKDKCSIRMNMEDIFHSWKYVNRSIALNQAYYFQTHTSDTQRVGIAFTYRFGNEIFARKRKNREDALDAEKSRL
ncbi:outer membrane beta-barrel family protein [Pedobacter heparinus]|uniref:outer membrane beta-barrel family protein n=1 Tax=Pedobacter heparinus TaxID=984 RepID=UPI0029301D04|nr:outer membrane beta-barrel family protein [Pedobacter heparinus]